MLSEWIAVMGKSAKSFTFINRWKFNETEYNTIFNRKHYAIITSSDNCSTWIAIALLVFTLSIISILNTLSLCVAQHLISLTERFWWILDGSSALDELMEERKTSDFRIKYRSHWVMIEWNLMVDKILSYLTVSGFASSKTNPFSRTWFHSTHSLHLSKSTDCSNKL